MNNLVLSTEKINDAQICPLKYHYKHDLRKAPDIKSPWLETGELIHEMLRIYYEFKKVGAPVQVESIINHGRNYAAKSLKIKAEEVEETIRDFRMYCNHYQNSDSWQIDAVEEPFAKILWERENLRIIVTGKIDLRVTTMGGKGPKALIDHKYEGRFDTKPNRDNQPLCYAWAYDINDFIYNRIGKQKSKKDDERLLRPYFCYNKHQINEWVESAIETALDLYKYYERDYFPSRITGCNFHHNKCDFYDICDTTPDNREYKLKSLFKNRGDSKLMEDSK